MKTTQKVAMEEAGPDNFPLTQDHLDAALRAAMKRRGEESGFDNLPLTRGHVDAALRLGQQEWALLSLMAADSDAKRSCPFARVLDELCPAVGDDTTRALVRLLCAGIVYLARNDHGEFLRIADCLQGKVAKPTDPESSRLAARPAGLPARWGDAVVDSTMPEAERH